MSLQSDMKSSGMDSRESISSKDLWETEPNAFAKSNHTILKSLRRLLESSRMERAKKECSKHPSTGMNPFCKGDIIAWSPQYPARRLASMAAKILYMAYCSAIGLQLLGSDGLPFL